MRRPFPTQMAAAASLFPPARASTTSALLAAWLLGASLAAQEWRLRAVPSARYGHALANDIGRGRSVLFGGFGGGYSLPSADTWEFDGDRWRQIPTAASPPARTRHALAYDLWRGRVVLFGGAFQLN